MSFKIDIEQIKKNDYKYYQLLIKQLIFIRREKKTLNKAQKVYNNTTIKKIPISPDMCVNFLSLESVSTQSKYPFDSH
ncbi:type III toxin-antitoxin system ToxN/AbiQ family toxin [Staphylococcus delphini]|uniref:type III toxin-antitoxin system ToxN/AbiQ family toxin n=1 Tax=Staphylococcus delphini TaxID=53344 RepID=UPI0030D17AAD